MAVERTKCKTVRKKGWDDAEVESVFFGFSLTEGLRVSGV